MWTMAVWGPTPHLEEVASLRNVGPRWTDLVSYLKTSQKFRFLWVNSQFLSVEQ